MKASEAQTRFQRLKRPQPNIHNGKLILHITIKTATHFKDVSDSFYSSRKLVSVVGKMSKTQYMASLKDKILRSCEGAKAKEEVDVLAVE